ncbi:MAG: divalent-cation tolerance protein CutA [PVC group bacterium]
MMNEPEDNPYIVVLMTSPDREEARTIALTLLEERLAACVSIFPRGESYFRWEGKIDQAEEFLLVAKTRGKKLNGLIGAVKKIHRYEVPEIVALPVSGGSREYLDWLGEEIK